MAPVEVTRAWSVGEYIEQVFPSSSHGRFRCFPVNTRVSNGIHHIAVPSGYEELAVRPFQVACNHETNDGMIPLSYLLHDVLNDLELSRGVFWRTIRNMELHASKRVYRPV
jgi:hypothetical protein